MEAEWLRTQVSCVVWLKDTPIRRGRRCMAMYHANGWGVVCRNPDLACLARAS